MPGTFRRWIADIRTTWEIARIARLCGTDNAVLANSLATITGNSCPFQAVRLGGVNNIGMFVHLSPGKDKPFALSKLQPVALAQREASFMRWQEEQGLHLSGRCINLTPVGASGYAILCSEYLLPPSTYDAERVHQLHRQFSAATGKLQALGDDLITKVEPDTPIKQVLRGLVAQSVTADIGGWCNRYLQERAELFGYLLADMQELFGSVARQWCRLAGPLVLVHGDFKRQNILADDAGEYRAIDLQYYLPGQPYWDLAFYYSKYDAGFSAAWQDFLKYTDQSFSGQQQFVFFYLVASTINVKRRRRNWIITTKVIPAMQEMERLLGDQKLEK